MSCDEGRNVLELKKSLEEKYKAELGSEIDELDPMSELVTKMLVEAEMMCDDKLEYPLTVDSDEDASSLELNGIESDDSGDELIHADDTVELSEEEALSELKVEIGKLTTTVPDNAPESKSVDVSV